LGDSVIRGSVSLQKCKSVLHAKQTCCNGGNEMTQETGQKTLLPTNEDTTGPYFPIYFRDESLEDLTRVDAGVA